MPNSTPCPDVPVLQRLMLGQVPGLQGERLVRHLKACSRCVAVVQSLPAEHALVEAARIRAQDAEGPDNDRLRDLIEQLALLVPWPTARSSRETNASDGASLRGGHPILTLPREPGELGRLGSYRVLKELGAGGMGVVFLAEDPQLRRQVALKVMRPDLAAVPLARERFLREARAMAAVKHDHIITIFLVSEEQGLPFLAMEFLEGRSLEQRLKAEYKLPLADVLRIGREIAEGLRAAHERGLIHRDIKPGNIWLEERFGSRCSEPSACCEERVKVLDFGLARGTADAKLTLSGTILGTPGYMAPEQVNGGPLDCRCDLFSLGCVLYRMCSGETPFRGRDTLSKLLALETEQPKQMVNLPAALNELILRLLAKKPDDRPGSAHVVVQQLRAIAATLASAPTSREPPTGEFRSVTGASATRNRLPQGDPQKTEFLPSRSRLAVPPNGAERTATESSPANRRVTSSEARSPHPRLILVAGAAVAIPLFVGCALLCWQYDYVARFVRNERLIVLEDDLDMRLEHVWIRDVANHVMRQVDSGAMKEIALRPGEDQIHVHVRGWHDPLVLNATVSRGGVQRFNVREELSKSGEGS